MKMTTITNGFYYPRCRHFHSLNRKIWKIYLKSIIVKRIGKLAQCSIKIFNNKHLLASDGRSLLSCCTLLAHISEMACRIWKWHENGTYFHHHFYLKNANLTVHYITGTCFFSPWPEFTVGDILWYVTKLWGQ